MSEEGVDHAPCQEEVARLTATLAQVTRERDEARSEAEKQRKSKDFHICYGEQIIHKLESRLATLEGAVKRIGSEQHCQHCEAAECSHRIAASALLPPAQERG